MLCMPFLQYRSLRRISRYLRWTTATAATCVIVAAGSISGCERSFRHAPSLDAECTDGCDNLCSSDACNSSCRCPDDQVCSETEQKCVPREACTETCEDRACGSVCGHDCGTCRSGLQCHEGQCLAAVHESCTDCRLRLVVDDVTWLADDLAEISLSITFTSLAESDKPRLIDLRLACDQPFEVLNAEEGPAMLAANRELFRYVGSRRFRYHPDGSAQFFAYSTSAAPTMGDGVLISTKVRLQGQVATCHLQRQDEIFAPAVANRLVQTDCYDNPVVVIR